MAIQGKQRVQADYSKKVGFDEFKIIAINPSKTELEELLNIPDMKEPQYIGTTQDDAGKEFPKSSVSVWLQGIKSASLFNVRYSLVNRERWNKDNTKQQFINDVGSTAWAPDVNALKDDKFKWFNTREFRPALSGEDKLYAFLQKFTNIDTRDPGVQITLDNKKLFKGNFSELQELLESEYKDNTLCGCATVRVVPSTDPDAEPGTFKEYQGIYDDFLPGSYISNFDGSKPGRSDYAKKYIETLEGEYGSKDFYFVGPIKDYVSAENPAVKELLRVAAVQSGKVPAGNTADIGPDGSPVDDLPF